MILVVLAMWLCVNTPALGQKAGRLYISISETRTEHSRDSNSTSKTIKVNGNALLYEESGRRRKPLHQEVSLTDQEVSKLKRQISEKRLLTSYLVEYPEASGPHTSIVLSLELKANGTESQIRISGAMNSKEMENDRVYQNAHAFLEEITELIDAKDESKPR